MLVERHWRVKVTDFNLSRMVQTTSSGSSVTSLLADNPRWLAPEVGHIFSLTPFSGPSPPPSPFSSPPPALPPLSSLPSQEVG